MVYKKRSYGTDIEIFQIILRGKKEKVKATYEKLNKFLDRLERENDVVFSIVDLDKNDYKGV